MVIKINDDKQELINLYDNNTNLWNYNDNVFSYKKYVYIDYLNILLNNELVVCVVDDVLRYHSITWYNQYDDDNDKKKENKKNVI